MASNDYLDNDLFECNNINYYTICNYHNSSIIFLCCWRLMYVCIFLVTLKVTEWPPIGKIAAHSANEMFSWYNYLIVSLVFPTLVFGVGVFF